LHLKKIDLNSAPLEQLTQLPELSFYQAQALFQQRQSLNGFQSLEQAAQAAKFNDHQLSVLYQHATVQPYHLRNRTRVVDY
jgi:DNA uptake protein ComE-like DNA-binding protein